MIPNKISVISVNPNGDWRTSTDALPAESTPLGTVTLVAGEIGALVREAGESIRLDGAVSENGSQRTLSRSQGPQ